MTEAIEAISTEAGNVFELDPKYLFRWEEPQQAYILLYPEGLVKLNETGAAILQLCDGKHTTEEIIAELNEKYTTDVRGGVNKFLEVSYAKGWIRAKS
ncbi:MAG: pyrroloquinoline quinone biosynthesis protein PqqD [Gammaproteobacteria bacterium RIFCSPLOWO2_12_47_11]|nr:MAG: pyrroloquinoline quinone biosynthesis protein PqqD [Gammaproteobacteria bacterium RIFCSPLOWO2_12_47_11]